MKKKLFWLGALLAGGAALVLLALVLRTYLGGRNTDVYAYLRDPSSHKDWEVQAMSRCADAPFLIPTEGYIGYLWQDSFKLFHPHQGIDIFGGTQPGVTPVYAPYNGFLTREPGWKSSLIIRVPQDPLQPDRQVWIYLTHLADPAGTSLIDTHFPPGTSETPVKAGDLLGYQGNYSGDPSNPVGVHLHLSIVRDDGTGHYLNELNIKNTLDPSPYFNLQLNARAASNTPPLCAARGSSQPLP